MKIVNPATEELICDIPEDDAGSLEQKSRLLHSSQPHWQQRSPDERVGILKKFSALLDKQKENLASILTSEMGKPLQQSRNEINGACSRIQWLTDNAVKYLSDEVMNSAGGVEEIISYEPLGVICNISAWNYPYLVGINVYVPALLAGNAVMYKPSEYATLTGLEVGKLMHEAGIPEAVFQTAVGGASIGEALLEIPFNGY